MKLLAFLAGLPLVCSCGEVVAPKVKCPADRVLIQLTQSASVPRAGLPCVFADPYPFTVSYAPEPEGGETDAGVSPASLARLVGQNVTITQGSAATRVCAEVAEVCKDGTSSVQTKISSTGMLAYQGLFSLEPLGVTLNAGDTLKWEGTVVTESFGPSNTCPWKAVVQLTCQKAQ